MKLLWVSMQASLPNVQMWGAADGLTSYVISRDNGCKPDDRFYQRYSLSSKLPGSPIIDLGQYDTLAEAKKVAEARRN